MSLGAAVRLAWLAGRPACASARRRVCVCVCVCVCAWKPSSLFCTLPPRPQCTPACTHATARRPGAVTHRKYRSVDAGVVTAFGRRRRHHEVFADVRARLHRHQHLARRCGRLARRRTRGVRVDVLRCEAQVDHSASRRRRAQCWRMTRADDGASRDEAGGTASVRRRGPVPTAVCVCARACARACVRV